MKLKFRLGVLAGLLLGSNVAMADGKIYLSASGGTFDHDKTNVILSSRSGTPPVTTTTWLTSDGDETDLVAVAAGVADVSARFLIEYYHQTGDLVGIGADYTKQSLYYSGYWTPNLYVPKLHGILGAGIGGSQITLESDNDAIGDEFEDRELQYKFTVGIEYRLLDQLTIFGTYEKHYSNNFTHSFSRTDTSTNPSTVTQWQIDVQDSDQSVIQIGLATRF
ncbi:MAG: hypothetical protein NVV73_11675 [Cellvibrionaceae bacterium]|nr:hypothetical protein [Cellvibrionaceae bacterium]